MITIERHFFRYNEILFKISTITKTSLLFYLHQFNDSDFMFFRSSKLAVNLHIKIITPVEANEETSLAAKICAYILPTKIKLTYKMILNLYN
ncbi:hypothetical protein BpHYR1_005744 [Brachionus plicatilis]|uniref:Uncharacterized protein n=1 Tax=Brachionus plicatilis TaxID=10195 RepID=A0A3M7S247_BRAPC|nr:hypothetical protein BpHYR1_005744 [Brachionus plicatilis]